MFTNIKAMKKVGFSPLGVACILATLVAVLYTTASDALVAPKLIWGNADMMVMKGYAQAQYSDVKFVMKNCLMPDKMLADPEAPISCLSSSLSGFGRSTTTSPLRHRSQESP